MFDANQELEIIAFAAANGKEPFTEWVMALDSVIRKRILVRLARLQVGNFGDCKKIDDGIFELRCFFGSGYRVYFGMEQELIVVLLCGGDKGLQIKDIQKAKQCWREYHEQKNTKSK